MTTATPEHLVAPPGDILEEWLDEQSMSQRELADRMGMSQKFVSQLINGKVSLTPGTAHALELISGVSAGTWLRIEADYQATLKHQEVVASNQDSSPFEASLIKALRDLGIVTAPWGNRGAQAVEVYRFLGVGSARGLEGLAARHATAFRTSHAFAPNPVATEVAIALVRAQAKLAAAQAFDANAVRAALPVLRSLAKQDPNSGARKAQEALQRAGVSLVFIPNVPKAHCTGITLWEGDRAVVGITEHGTREDIFWFTLFHELAHVLDEDKGGIYLNATSGTDKNDLEQRADAFAADHLIPVEDRPKLDSIENFEDLRRVSRECGISQGVAVGYLHRHGLKPRSWETQLLRKVELEQLDLPPHSSRPVTS